MRPSLDDDTLRIELKFAEETTGLAPIIGVI